MKSQVKRKRTDVNLPSEEQMGQQTNQSDVTGAKLAKQKWKKVEVLNLSGNFRPIITNC